MDSNTTADVQAELQEYLNSKNINNLFIQIVESLLIEKPDNPIGFIVEYLQKKYPEQANVGATKSGSDIPKSIRQSSLESDYTDTDSEGEEGDAVGEIRDKMEASHASISRSRRVSVSAESVDPGKVQQEIKVIEKDPAEAARILEILHDNVLFKHLDESQMDTLKGAMFEVQHSDGDIIIQQGDDGDNFYMIDTGSVEVSIDGTKRHMLNQGDSFGELAIMYNAPRAATCTAATNCKLWALDRATFKVIVMHTTINKRNLHKSFLQNVPLLETLTEYEILTIADALQEEKFKAGEIICEQGQPGHQFYIIKEGSATCYMTDARGNRMERANLGPGSYFGEIALLEDKPRQASIVAKEAIKVLSLDRKTFKRVMGPLEDILKRNMDHYNRVVASAI